MFPAAYSEVVTQLKKKKIKVCMIGCLGTFVSVVITQVFDFCGDGFLDLHKTVTTHLYD